MDVFICDLGLRDQLSHHFNYVRAFAEELRKLKARVEIYGHRHCEPNVLEELRATPHFEHHIYHYHGAHHALDEEKNWVLGNQSYRRDMDRLEQVAKRDALVIVPAITQHQIDGLARWFEALPPERRPKLAVSLMFAPQWTPWGLRAVRGPEYYARAIERLKPWLGKSVLLYTETREASSYFQQLTDTPVSVAPIPCPRTEDEMGPRRNGRLRFGYLGHSRREKGFHLLPLAVSICQRQQVIFDLTVQIAQNHNDPMLTSAGEALGAQSNITAIIGPLSPDRHYRVLTSCDAVLLPYDPHMYRIRGSALFAEAIALGKPMVVSAGTFMENSAKRGECIARICKFNAADLARAMGEVCSDFNRMHAQAKVTARKWQETNNLSAFCQKLVASVEG